MKAKKFLLIAVLPLILVSCWDFDDFENIALEPIEQSWVFPLVNSQITLMDMLDATGNDTSLFFQVRNDSIIIHVLQSIDYYLDLELPDNSFNQTIPVVPNSSEVFFDGYTTIENESEIKGIDFKEGELWVEFNKDFPDDIEVELEISSLKISGDNSFRVNANWDENPYSSNHTFNLDDTHLDLFRVEGGDTLYNVLSYSVNVGNTDATGNLNLSVGFRDMTYNKIEGDIKYYQDFGTSEIGLDFFSSIQDGEIELTKPSFNIDIGSSFGVPISLLIEEMRFENNNEEFINLQNTGTSGNPFLISQPNYIPYATESEPYVTISYVLDYANSNIEEILPLAPSKVLFSGGYELGDFDPSQTYEYIHNFFLIDSSQLSIDFEIEVPLIGRMDDLTLSYTLDDISLNRFDESDNFTLDDYNIELIIKSENGIPLNFSLQAIFMDDSDTQLEVFEIDSLISSPSIDSNGNPMGTSESTSTISLTKEMYENMTESSKVELRFLVNTGDDSNNEVIIKASQFLDLRMSLYFDFKIDAN